MMSSIAYVQVIWLLVLSPMLLRFMEGLYKPKKRVGLDLVSDSDSESHFSIGITTAGEGGGSVDEEEAEPPRGDEWKASMIARRDVHVVLISYLLEAISKFCIGLVQNGTQFILGNPYLRPVMVPTYSNL
jgi:hypothetical protein